LSAAHYLEAIQSPTDGSWQSEGSQVRFLETSAAIAALEAVNRRSHIYYSGVTWLANHAAGNVDYLARRAIALSKHHANTTPDVVAILESRKDAVGTNGGYGLDAIYEGSPLDTALVLQAIKASAIDNSIANAGISHLKLTQRPTAPRGWSVAWATDAASPFDATVTAQVLIALQPYAATDSALPAVISNGLDAIKTQVNTSSPIRIRALATLAYLTAKSSTDSYATTMLSSLLTAQATDGHWGYGIYDTALVLQVLAVAANRDLAADRTIVDVPDEQLRYAINQQLGRNAMDQLNQGELKQLTTLSAASRGITNLTGLQYATNLSLSDLSNNQISSVSPITGLPGYSAFNLTGNPIESANRALAIVGQTLTTSRTLPNGVPLKVRVLSLINGEMRYEPASIDLATPALTLRGMLEWMNVFGVIPDPDDPANLYTVSTSFVQDPRFPVDDPMMRGRVRSAIKMMTHSGTEVELDTVSGEIISLGRFGHPSMRSDLGVRSNSFSGGWWIADNIRYLLKSKTALGDLNGANELYEGVAEDIVRRTQVPLWRYGSMTGPAAIPFAALAGASSVSALPSVLQNAGFTIENVTATYITFAGTYIFNNLVASNGLKEYMCYALFCSLSAESALMSADANHIGSFRVPLRLRISLVP
jgi:hypothetical protein